MMGSGAASGEGRARIAAEAAGPHPFSRTSISQAAHGIS